ncbi:MAG: radical SAM protein [Candidatus Scalindua sp.]|nr:radical SAM protein [Candidatus Scalindua sp.]
MVLRAKTTNLLQTKTLTEKQRKNSELNTGESKEGNTVLQSYPRRVILELTNACNLKCLMCGRDESEFNNRFFDLSYLKKLDTVLEHAEEVTLFGWGEPTIHPKFVDLLKYMDRFPVRKYFVTNGTRLKKLKNAIFDYNVDIIAISLDGASALTNDRIRVGASYEEIITGLSSIVEEKNRRKSSFPYMNFVFTVMQSNIHELPEMIKLAARIGLEEVKVVYLTVFSESLLHESLWDSSSEVKDVFDEAVRLSEELGIKIKLPYLQGEDVAGQQYHKDCFVGWRDFFLGSDGYVRPCQSTAMKLFSDNRYSTFEEMWNSAEYQDFRGRVNAHDSMPEECKRCYQSSHANWNKKESFIQTGEAFAPEWEKKKS